MSEAEDLKNELILGNLPPIKTEEVPKEVVEVPIEAVVAPDPVYHFTYDKEMSLEPHFIFHLDLHMEPNNRIRYHYVKSNGDLLNDISGQATKEELVDFHTKLGDFLSQL